ncbi:hypothetical protein ACFX2H_022917 [Malus domestica]
MVVVFYSNTSSINLNKGIEGSSSASKFIPNSLAAPGKATRINNPPATNPPPQAVQMGVDASVQRIAVLEKVLDVNNRDGEEALEDATA